MRVRNVSRFQLILSVGLIWSILGSCGDPTDPDPLDFGQLTVSVQVEGEGFGEIQIRVTGPDTRAVTTNPEGVALFPDLWPGDYTVIITTPPTAVEFPATTDSVAVPSGGSATTSFIGTWKPGSLVGLVELDGVPMPGETLELHGPVSRYTNTNLSGHFEFPDLPAGEYTLELMGFGGWPYDFPETSITATVTSTETTRVEFLGTELPPGVIVGQVFLDQDGDYEFDPGEPRVGGGHLSVDIVENGGGGNLRDNGEYQALHVKPGGPYTLYLHRFSKENPWGIVSAEYAVDPGYTGNQNIFVEGGATVRVDLPVVPGVQEKVFASGKNITLTSGVELAVPPYTFSEGTVVSLIPSSVDVGHETIPTMGIYPSGLTLPENATLRFSAPLFVQYPAGSTVWYYDEQTERYAWIPTTLSNDRQEASVNFGQFRVFLAPFFSDPAFWPDLGDWFLGPATTNFFPD